MAKVKIQGHASGSGVFTITAPNSNTDRTITLPDASVTLGTDATKLPLAGGAMSGTITNFTSTGIDDNANANAITIDSSEKIGIGTTSPGCAAKGVHIKTSSAGTFPSLQTDADDLVIEGSTPGITLLGAANGGGMLAFGDPDDADAGRIFYYHINNTMDFVTAGATAMQITSDGRGLSQFTAKAWIQMDMSNMSINDSHNFSSVTDVATGQARCNYSNALGNATPAVATSGPAGYISATSNVNSTSFYLRSSDTNGSAADTDKNMAIVFGD